MVRSLLQDEFPDELVLELVEHIVDFPIRDTEWSIPQRGYIPLDLLRLGLTCKRLSEILIPIVLEYNLARLRVMHGAPLDDIFHGKRSQHILNLYDEERPQHILDLYDGESSGTSTPIHLGSQIEWPQDKVYGHQLDCVVLRIERYNVEDVWCLQMLVVRAKRIGTLKIDFANTYRLTDWDHETREEWIRGFLALINSCLWHEGSELTVVGHSKQFDESWFPFTHQFPATMMPTGGTSPSVAKASPFVPSPTTLTKEPEFLHKLINLYKRSARSWFTTSTPLISNTQKPDDATPRAQHKPIISPEYKMTSTLKPATVIIPNDKIPESRLSRLSLYSPVFLGPSWFAYTQQVMQQSSDSLTTLHIDLPLTLFDWHEILPTWEFPCLATLGTQGSQIAFPDLRDFLLRHPSVTEIDLTRGVLIGTVDANLPQDKFLPNLGRLTANPEYVTSLLKLPSLFPKLKSITITEETCNRCPWDKKEYLEIMRLISARPSITNLGLVFAKSANIKEWVKEQTNMILSRRPSSIQTLFLRFAASYPSEAAYGCEADNGEGVRRIMDFMENFPALVKVVLVDIFDLAALESWNLSAPLEERNRPWTMCPKLQRLDVGSQSFTRPNTVLIDDTKHTGSYP